MIQLICNGVEVDVPRGTSIAWKNTNILFAFDKASCERSLTFTLPSTATNDTVFELCRLPQYVGQGFRRLYDAEYRDGLLVKRGYAYVTQSQRSGYNVTLVVGELTALKRLKDAGKVGEVLPDAAVTVPKAEVDARQAEYSGLKVLKTVHTDLTQNIMPSWCFRPLLVDVLNELQVPFALPSVAEDLRIMIKGLNGAKTSVKFKNVRHSDVTGPTKDAQAVDKYNTLSVSDDTWIEALDMQIFQGSTDGYMLYDNLPLHATAVERYNGNPDAEPPVDRNVFFVGDFNAPKRRYYYNSGVFHTKVPVKVTFPSDTPDDIMLIKVAYEGSGVCQSFPWNYLPQVNALYIYPIASMGFMPQSYMPFKGANDVDYPEDVNNYPDFNPTTGIADTTPGALDLDNVSLAGITVPIEADTYFVIIRREDFACACNHDLGGNVEFLFGLQPRFNDYEFDIEVEADIVDTPTDWTFSKRQNSPDMTAVDMLKTLANVSGKVLYYTDANGISFEDLLLTDFTQLDLTSKLIAIKTLKPRFSDYDKANIVKYKDDDMTTQQDMISIDYESNAAMLQGEKTLQTLPFSCVSNSRVFVGSETGEYFDRARVVDGNNKKPSADVLLTINANDTFTQRVPLIKNPTIQQLCKEPLTIEATLHMSNYEYSQIQPFSLIHLNGVDYVWTESNWQKGTATLTLSKLPLTIGQGTPLYTYFDYIESDGNGQYIDTGVCVGGDWSIEIDAIWLYSNSGASISDWIVGARDAYQVNDYSMRGQGGGFRMRYYTDLPYSNAVTYQHYYSYQRHRNDLTIYDGDVVFYHSVPGIRTTTPSYTHYLFAMNNAGSAIVESYTKRIGNVRIYDSNDVLVRDFRPAVRIADGVAGMHDVVNDVFYTNANPAGDNFLYGNF
jgi:hypothetical protein